MCIIDAKSSTVRRLVAAFFFPSAFSLLIIWPKLDYSALLSWASHPASKARPVGAGGAGDARGARGGPWQIKGDSLCPPYCYCRRACGHVDVGTYPHQVLAATLTLSQPGGQIMPTLYWCPHQVLKATGAPVHSVYCMSTVNSAFHSTYTFCFFFKWIFFSKYVISK